MRTRPYSPTHLPPASMTRTCTDALALSLFASTLPAVPPTARQHLLGTLAERIALHTPPTMTKSYVLLICAGDSKIVAADSNSWEKPSATSKEGIRRAMIGGENVGGIKAPPVPLQRSRRKGTWGSPVKLRQSPALAVSPPSHQVLIEHKRGCLVASPW